MPVRTLLVSFSTAAIVLSTERVLKPGILIPCVLIVDGFVRAVGRGAAGKPSLDSRPASAEKFKLTVKPVATMCPDHRERKPPEVGGLRSV